MEVYRVLLGYRQPRSPVSFPFKKEYNLNYARDPAVFYIPRVAQGKSISDIFTLGLSQGTHFK